MSGSIFNKQMRRLQRKIRRQTRRFVRHGGRVMLTVGLCMAVVFAARIITMPTIDRSSYRPLLQAIAKGESNGNYNAYYGKPNNDTILFTRMTLQQVLDWQQAYVAQGSVSSAVGKYQIIEGTLRGLITDNNIELSRLFDESLQDELAILLIERRGSEAYASSTISREDFAANLAKEWAALPKIVGSDPEQSYYAGDGINKSNISSGEIFTAIESIKYD